MNLRFFHGMIDDNYGWELELFRRNRDSKDGFTTVDFKINFDKYVADHNPRFEFSLVLLNFLIFDFTIYNIWHTEHEASPYYESHTEKSSIRVIYHSRRNFYQGLNIYWYEFSFNNANPDVFDQIDDRFLRVPGTKYYEFGGTHQEALTLLASLGVTSITEGEQI